MKEGLLRSLGRFFRRTPHIPIEEPRTSDGINRNEETCNPEFDVSPSPGGGGQEEEGTEVVQGEIPPGAIDNDYPPEVVERIYAMWRGEIEGPVISNYDRESGEWEFIYPGSSEQGDVD
jgi:hypothetical protein